MSEKPTGAHVTRNVNAVHQPEELRTNPKPCRNTRRRFLGTGGRMAAGALAAPWIIPSSVLGGDGRTGANERITVGIISMGVRGEIGMGVRGEQLVMNIPESGRVAAVCDADLPKAAAVTKKFQADWKVYQDYRALIEQPDLDAVILTACRE